MNFIETRELVISTLSPVHIGCGEDYEPTNYVVTDKGILHALEPFTVASAGGEALVADIEKVMQKGDGTTQLRAAHAILQKYRDRLAPVAKAAIPMCMGVLAHYRETQNARNDFNSNGIERTAFNLIDQTPYLPGSSIKGAIHTAWLCAQGIDRSPIPLSVKQRIADFNDMIEEALLGDGKSILQLKMRITKREYEKERKDIEKELSKAAEVLDPEWLGGTFETSPMRALKVGDARPAFPDIEREIRFCINRSRSGRVTQAQNGKLYTRLEYIAEHQPAAFGCQLTLQALDSIAGFRDPKGRRLAPDADNLLSWPGLVKACNDYYRPRLDADVATVRMLKPNSTWVAQTRELLDNGLREDIRSGKCLLLRVGKHAGADSNTVIGRQVKVMLNECRREVDAREERTRLWVFEDAPRTTWFCGDDLEQPADLLPHGWVVLGPADASWLFPMAGHARRTERRRQAELLFRQREEAEATARREAAEQEARAALIAAMTPHQREVQAFQEKCQRRFDQFPGSKEKRDQPLHNMARELTSAAISGADWTAEEKRQLAEVVEVWLPKVVHIDLSDKTERKKLRLAVLRGQVP